MNLNEVEKLANKLMAQHGLIPGWAFQFNNRRRLLALCKIGPEYGRVIEVSRIYAACADYDSIKDTLLHEIAHAIVGPERGHDDTWKAMCVKVGAIPSPEQCNRPIPGFWNAICSTCSMVYSRYHKPSPNLQYSCSVCKTALSFERDEKGAHHGTVA